MHSIKHVYLKIDYFLDKAWLLSMTDYVCVYSPYPTEHKQTDRFLKAAQMRLWLMEYSCIFYLNVAVSPWSPIA